MERIDSPDPRLLLGSTFVLGIQTPERLKRQLDLCAAIVRGVPLFRLRVAPGVGSAQLAAVADEHARQALASQAKSAA